MHSTDFGCTYQKSFDLYFTAEVSYWLLLLFLNFQQQNQRRICFVISHEPVSIARFLVIGSVSLGTPDNSASRLEIFMTLWDGIFDLIEFFFARAGLSLHTMYFFTPEARSGCGIICLECVTWCTTDYSNKQMDSRFSKPLKKQNMNKDCCSTEFKE